MWGHLVMKGGMAVCCLGPAMAEGQGFRETFVGIGKEWHIANYDFSHPAFDTDWRPSQVDIDQGLLLNLSPQEGAQNRFVGASVRRTEPTGFGRYEVVMKAARGPGVVTGFFTYTGPHYGTKHDEIDIEFLGRDTTKMHVAWFVDGELTNKFIDLGFDAADADRRFAFEWWPERLAWFVEDQMIHEHHVSSGEIPDEPGRLFVNIWAAHPSIAEWAGTVTPGASGQARVREVRFEPFDLND